MDDDAIKFLTNEFPNVLIRDGEWPSHLCHFSSLDSAFHILKNKSFHASHVGFMNDPYDCLELYEAVLRVLKGIISVSVRGANGYLSNDAGGIYSREIFPDPRHYFLVNLYLNMREINKFHASDDLSLSGRFCVSFASDTDFDRLNYWRTYGDDGVGVGLVFNTNSILNSVLSGRQIISDYAVESKSKLSNVALLRCHYVESNYLNVFAARFVGLIVERAESIFNLSDIQIISMINRITSYVLFMSSAVKSSQYEIENECRLFIDDRGGDDQSDIDFKISGKTIIPYKNIKYELNNLNEIILGPKFRKRERSEISMKIFIKSLMENESVKSVPVRVSEVKYVDNK